MNNYLKLTSSFFALMAITFSVNTISQEIEEVVVTATKKEQSTQDIAVSITAVTADGSKIVMIPLYIHPLESRMS